MTPAETTEVPGPDLFMTVIKVADWPRAVAWYVDTLGLLAVLTDPEREFALLAAGTGRWRFREDARRRWPEQSDSFSRCPTSNRSGIG